MYEVTIHLRAKHPLSTLLKNFKQKKKKKGRFAIEGEHAFFFFCKICWT